MGYYRAGFEVVGVDVQPQKNYPFEFVRMDALEFIRRYGREFDAVAASPPCQDYSVLKHLAKRNHPDLVGVTRDALERNGRPYVMENVRGAPLQATIMLCGTMFGLGTPCGAELQRHRYFEAPWFAGFVPECRHGRGPTIMVVGDAARDPAAKNKVITVVGHSPVRPRVISVCGDTPHDPAIWRASKRLGKRVISIAGKGFDNPATVNHKARTITVAGSTPQQNGAGSTHNQIRETFTVAEARIAMGIHWMTGKELSQAIPPAYTEWIGVRLMEFLS